MHKQYLEVYHFLQAIIEYPEISLRERAEFTCLLKDKDSLIQIQQRVCQRVCY